MSIVVQSRRLIFLLEWPMEKIAVGAKVPIAWTVAGMLFFLSLVRGRGEERRGEEIRGERREEKRRGEERRGEERKMEKIAVGAKVPIAWTVAGMLFFLSLVRGREEKRRGEERRGEERRGEERRGDKRGEKRRGEERGGERDGRG